MDRHKLPFKVGQLVETRSFLPGYRGAWFKCKIKEIGYRNGQLGHALEYCDFPDEKIEWTKIYQKPQNGGCKAKGVKRQLMVRPCFPHVYHESQMPEICSISEEVVIVCDSWKVGDLVDWWTDDCYWSGRVTATLADEKVQIELQPPPLGEGLTYEAFCKDLRPSLDWSPNDGWTVPFTMQGEKGCCSRLIKPVNQVLVAEGSSDLMVHAQGRKELNATTGASVDHNLLYSSCLSASSLPPQHATGRPVTQPLSNTVPEEIQTSVLHATGERKVKTSATTRASVDHSLSYSSRVSASSSLPQDRVKQPLSIAESNKSLKRTKVDEDISLNCIRPETIEAAIVDMEELLNRVKWIKQILEFEIPLSNTARPSWKFVEHRASSTPK